MEEAEKMAALKKAYADIILNTAKEAAARILVSERKALRFQQELFAAKEEALNTLLRLKQVMDSKIAKAGEVSLDQTRKIQELEAQLGEAEDTVKDLREELKRVQDELDKMKNNLVGPLRVEPVKESNSGYLSSDTDVNHSKQKTPDDKSNFLSETPSTQSEPELNNPDFASIIMGSKETELFRNGCTQRIRAFEQNILTGKKFLLSGHADGKYPCEKNQLVTEEDESADQRLACLPAEAEVKVDHSENLVGLGESNRDRDQVVMFFRRFSSRRKRGRCTYMKALTAEEEPSETITDTSLKVVDSRFPFHSCKSLDDVKVRRGTADTEAATEENNEKLSADNRTDNTSVSETNLETVEVPVEARDAECSKRHEANGTTTAVNDGYLKYTFCRKRKRESLSSHKDEVVEKSTSKRRGRDTKQTTPAGPEKPGTVTESARASRRLVQVARQLISLSEKRWW